MAMIAVIKIELLHILLISMTKTSPILRGGDTSAREQLDAFLCMKTCELASNAFGQLENPSSRYFLFVCCPFICYGNVLLFYMLYNSRMYAFSRVESLLSSAKRMFSLSCGGNVVRYFVSSNIHIRLFTTFSVRFFFFSQWECVFPPFAIEYLPCAALRRTEIECTRQ